MFKTFPFTKLFLISIILIILGWIINALIWTGFIPWFDQGIFIAIAIMYFGFALCIVSLILGLFKIIRNV